MPNNSDLPPELEQRIATAQAALEAHDDGHLPLGERRRVRELFGGPGYGPQERTPGRRRRFALHRACVDRVLPVWRAVRPDDHRPDRMVELAQQLMDGTTSEEAIQAEQDDFFVDLMDMGGDIGGRALGAGDAAVDLISTAAVGDYGEETPLEDDDRDLDPDSLEASFLGSMAVASLAGEPDDDPQARREYWRWYLQEAVPAAYRAVGDE